MPLALAELLEEMPGALLAVGVGQQGGKVAESDDGAAPSAVRGVVLQGRVERLGEQGCSRIVGSDDGKGVDAFDEAVQLACPQLSISAGVTHVMRLRPKPSCSAEASSAAVAASARGCALTTASRSFALPVTNGA